MFYFFTTMHNERKKSRIPPSPYETRAVCVCAMRVAPQQRFCGTAEWWFGRCVLVVRARTGRHTRRHSSRRMYRRRPPRFILSAARPPLRRRLRPNGPSPRGPVRPSRTAIIIQYYHPRGIFVDFPLPPRPSLLPLGVPV